MKKIRVGIYGYGNIAKGVERTIAKNDDISLEAIFTRRDPSKIKTISGVKATSVDKVLDYVNKIDVMLLCGGSATDLPVQGPELAKHFNIVDTFDNHLRISEYLDAVDRQAKAHKKAAIISAGWDPGLFSMMKALFSFLLPEGKSQSFWGPGVSQGHSEAIRRIDGVTGAIQYTVPYEDVMDEVSNGSKKEYTARQKHKRVCYVAVKEGADKEKIAKTIREMPNYFADYDVEINFVSSEVLERDHGKMPHGGHVFRNGETAGGEGYAMSYSMRFGSNPEFTASIMTAFARAAFRLSGENEFGAKTALDIPLSYLSPKGRNEQIKEFL
ncbi:MAG: diaminopimelate dehydrogenase [Methanomassiliicoccaceae archaeon]|jgi:diaminopimelate dehydrogenase|nr:diaminopimelate dehydrogenase [Methanomassiliicoccaceae archaeon]